MKPTVCSLFAGIGGIDIGFQQAGFNVVWANEYDPAACRTYRKNFGNSNLVEGIFVTFLLQAFRALMY